MGAESPRWRDYVRGYLRRLGYITGLESIINLILAYLQSIGFNLPDAENKLVRRRFRRSLEQRQTSSAVRQILYLEPGDEGPRRRSRTEPLNDYDPAAEDIQADPALLLAQEELAAAATAALESFTPQDREILYKISIEGVTYRELANELSLPLSSLHVRVQKLHSSLALLIAQSRNRSPRV
jgi:DNA-directed RNA polymerase specialized sigma24 family protein